MKILLIAPASGYWRRIGRRRFFNGKTFRFSMLPLLSVAELSPGTRRLRSLMNSFRTFPTAISTW